MIIQSAKWARTKSHVSSELPKMPTLVGSAQGGAGEELATFFENKTRFLANEFFPTSPPADLNDIAGATYSSSMQCSAIVMKEEMIEIMKKLNSNKTFKSNDIINRFLKICGNGLINVLTSFFQMCVNQKYLGGHHTNLSI